MSNIDHSAPPLQVPPGLRPYTVPASEYLTSTSTQSTSTIHVSALIFTTASSSSKLHRHEDYILLVAHGGQWDLPGGSCENDDPSIIHSCTRTIREKTGLHATSVSAVLGQSHQNGVLRLDFELQVREAPNRPLDLKDIPVELDGKQYDEFAWATEKQIKSGEYGLDGEVRNAVLEGFAHREESKHARQSNLYFNS